MRTRYSAYAVGNFDYLWRTWHPRTRPDNVANNGLVWTGLEIIDIVAGGPGEGCGEVEFRAHYRGGILHERSRFAVRAGRWLYLDGNVNGT